MSNCVSGCPGHRGKFPNCLTEALFRESLEGADESTGSVQAYGHFTLMQFDKDEPVRVFEGEFVVPAGTYLLGTNERGSVWVEAEGDAARKRYDEEDAAYGDWSDGED